MIGLTLFGLFLLLIAGLGFVALRREAFTADEGQFPTHDGDGNVR